MIIGHGQNGREVAAAKKSRRQGIRARRAGADKYREVRGVPDFEMPSGSKA